MTPEGSFLLESFLHVNMGM